MESSICDPTNRRNLNAINNAPQPTLTSDADQVMAVSRSHLWHWNTAHKSHECFVSDDKLEVCFHPISSESAAAIRGSEPLTNDRDFYFWQVAVADKTYGTAMMFGICTENQPMHLNDYCNLIGLDRSGWSLSHKGLIWHDNESYEYTSVFPKDLPVTVGVLYNVKRGELSYFLNGRNLGVAFSGLDKVQGSLYPVIGSTAKCTRMRLVSSHCGFVSLLERSCSAILRSQNFLLRQHDHHHHHHHRNQVDQQHIQLDKLLNDLRQKRLPNSLIEYLSKEAIATGAVIPYQPNDNDQSSTPNELSSLAAIAADNNSDLELSPVIWPDSVSEVIKVQSFLIRAREIDRTLAAASLYLIPQLPGLDPANHI